MKYQTLTVHTDTQTRDIKREIMERACKLLADNYVYPGEVWVYPDDDTLYVEIEGDWKHDHLRCDWLLQSVGLEMKGVNVTEEDGSDYYTAIRMFSMKDMLWNVSHYGWKTKEWRVDR